MAIQAGQVVWNVTADLRPLNQALVEARRSVKSSFSEIGGIARNIGYALAAAGAAIGGSFLKVGSTFRSLGDESATMASQIGISVESFQELSYALDMLDVDRETFVTGMARLARQMGDAKLGSHAAQRAFGVLGITWQQLWNAKPDQMFMMIAERIKQIPDPAFRAAIAQDLFGRSAYKLMPALSEGAGRIQQLRAEAQRLGVVMSADGVRSAQAYDDAMKRLKYSWQAFVIAVGPAVAQAIQSLVPIITNVVKAIGDWVKANPQLSASIAKWVGGFAAIASVVAPILIILPNVVTAISMIGTAIAAVAAGISAPIAIISAAVVGAAILIYQYWSPIKEFFQQLWSSVVEIFQGAWETIKKIVDAIINGATNVIKSVGRVLGIGGEATSVPAYQSGGLHRGGLALVGEQGAELVYLPTGSRIVDHATTQRILNNTTNTSVGNINVSLNVNGGTSDPRQLARALSDLLAEQVRNALARRGASPALSIPV